MRRSIVVLLCLVAAVALAGCGGDGGGSTVAQPSPPDNPVPPPPEPPATSPAPAPAPPPPPTPPAAPPPQRIVIVVEGGTPRGGIARPKIDKGRKVVIVVRSDTADELHLHGYDISGKVAAGGTARLAFAATIPGRFELELEESGVQLAELTVQ